MSIRKKIVVEFVVDDTWTLSQSLSAFDMALNNLRGEYSTTGLFGLWGDKQFRSRIVSAGELEEPQKEDVKEPQKEDVKEPQKEDVKAWLHTTSGRSKSSAKVKSS